MYVFGTWKALVLSVLFNSRGRGRDLCFESENCLLERQAAYVSLMALGRLPLLVKSSGR